MRTYWPRGPAPGNVGDLVTPYMMRKDGVEPEYVGPMESGKVLGVGSTIRYAQAGDMVWTSGIMRAGEGGDPGAVYGAVRGPLTAEAMGLAGLPMGDGALCLPRYFQAEPVGFWELGVVPHYIDLPHRDEWPDGWDTARVISPLTTDIERFIDLVTGCDRIESSSLHGCVIAEAYGIPWKWVRVGDRLNGDDSKFRDFQLSLPHVDVDALMEARPWI